MYQTEDKTVQINGSPIHTIRAGDHTGSTVLFLHGKAFQAETWKELGTLEAVLRAGFSIIALDLPGFGKSPESPLTPEQVIGGVMDEAGLKKIVLAGPSMGGKIAMEFCLDNPEKIAGLVLLGAVGVEENRDRLPQLPAETLILWGENDQISDPKNGALLEQSIPGSKRIIFKDAKHPCYLEQPKLWHESLLNFVHTLTGQHDR